jgi:hypothetical protein
MRVYVATLVDLENTTVVGVYTSEDIAISKLEEAMEDLYFSKEDYGVSPEVVQKYIDDAEDDDFA